MIISPPRQQRFQIDPPKLWTPHGPMSALLISLKNFEKGDQQQQQQNIYVFRSNDSTHQATLTNKR